MGNEERVIKHLEMIQGVIERMARNSFMLKGWAVTLVAAFLWLFARFFGEMKAGEMILIGIAIIAIVNVFWRLDKYFLRQERLFRKLYDYIRKQGSTDFSMDTRPYTKEVDNIGYTYAGRNLPFDTLCVFYSPLICIGTGVIGLGFFAIIL